MRLLTSLALSLAVLGSARADAAEVNIYTTRETQLIQPLLDVYTKLTGTKINVVFLKDGMAERIAAEGESSPADLMMAIDVGNLVDLVEKGLTQPIQSEVINAAIPANLRGATASGSDYPGALGLYMQPRISTLTPSPTRTSLIRSTRDRFASGQASTPTTRH